jgi:ABC-type branched-subunit amino acid transport system substrate-binding protein
MTSSITPAPASGNWRQLLIVVAESVGEVVLHDALDGSILARVAVGSLPHEVVVSPDGKTAYVSNFGLQDYDERIGTPGSSISVIDLDLMCETHRLHTFNAMTGQTYRAPHGLGLSPDGSLLYVSVEQGAMILTFDLATRQMREPLLLPPRTTPAVSASATDGPPQSSFPEASKCTHNMVVSTDGTAIFLMAADHDPTAPDNGVFKIDATSGELLAQAVLQNVHGLHYTMDQQALLACGFNCYWILDPATLKVLETHAMPSGQILYGVPTRDGRFVFPCVWYSSVIVAYGDDVLARNVTGVDPVHVVVSPDGSQSWITNARSDYITRLGLTNYDMENIPTGEGPNGIAMAPYRPYTERQTLTFGAVLPLNMPEGRELMIGYEFWKERVNAAGGLAIGGIPYKVETIYLDTQGVDAQAGVLTTTLIDFYHVDFLLGTYPSSAHVSAAAVANARKVPMVTASGAASVLYTTGGYLFGILSPAGGYLTGAVNLATSATPPAKSCVLLSCDDPAALQDALATAKLIVSKGVQLLTPPTTPPGIKAIQNGVWVYPHMSTDFSGAVAAAKLLAPDLVLVAGHQPESEAFVKAAASGSLVARGFVFSVGPSLPSFATDLGALANQMIGAAQWAPGYPIPGYDRFGFASDFAAAYWNRYNLLSSYLSAGAAACGVIYERALQTAGSTDAQAVHDALAATDTFTFYGRVQLDATGQNANKPILTVQDIVAADGSVTMAIVSPPAFASGHGMVWPFTGWPGATSTVPAGRA